MKIDHAAWTHARIKIENDSFYPELNAQVYSIHGRTFNVLPINTPKARNAVWFASFDVIILDYNDPLGTLRTRLTY